MTKKSATRNNHDEVMDVGAILTLEPKSRQTLAPAEQTDVQAVVIGELRRLHEGVLARYPSKPSELEIWRQRQS
jgi:hypothetical protein